MYEIDPTVPESVWTYGEVRVNHSVQRLPDGNLIFIHTQHAHHPEYGIDVDGDGQNEIRVDSVRVIDPNGTMLWDWSLFEHDPDATPSPIYSMLTEWWSNCNAVSFVPDAAWTEGVALFGDVYLNCRLLNRLYKINYPSAEIEWVMGDDGDFGQGFFYHCHDPQISFATDGDGKRIATRILLYDNREGPPLGDIDPCPLDEVCPEDIEPYTRINEVEFDNDLNADIIWKWPSPTSPDLMRSSSSHPWRAACPSSRTATSSSPTPPKGAIPSRPSTRQPAAGLWRSSGTAPSRAVR